MIQELTMDYSTDRLSIRSTRIEDASKYQKYLVDNRSFLQPWQPNREDDFYALENIVTLFEKQIEENIERKSINLYLFMKSEQEIIGTISLSNIVYGAFLSGYLGYNLCEAYADKGYMTEALGKALKLFFDEMKLHRIEANVMPRNIRSKKLLQKLGFECEGVSKKYLKINGKWEDHEHHVLLNDKIE